MDASLSAQLGKGLQSLNLELDEEQQRKLLQFIQLLEGWFSYL